MKTLDFNQMENLQGGIGKYFVCGFGIGLGATLGFAIGGPAGSAFGGILLGSMTCAENAY